MSGAVKSFRRNVSVTSLVATELGTPGELREEAGGKLYKLVKASASLSHGAGVQYAIATDETAGTVVQVHVNNNGRDNGVMNADVTSVAADTFFWMQYRGVGPVLNGAGTPASNVYLAGSTAGAVSVASTANHALCYRTIGSVAATVTADMHIFCDE